MTLSTLLGVLFGSIGAVFLNVGKGVQKMKVHVWKNGLRPAFGAEQRHDLRIWFVGWTMTAGASVFISLGLAFEDASVVSAMTGVGLIALVIFSARILEEQVGPREITGVLVVILGTTLLALWKEASPDVESFRLSVVGWALAAGAAIFALPVLFTMTTGKLHGLIYGLVAGSLLGFSLTLGKVAMVAAAQLGSDLPLLIAQLQTPYPYMALTIGTGALVMTQVAFFKGRAVVVVPCVNSVMILVPAIVERELFGTALSLRQYGALGVIILGVIVISTSRDAAA